VRTPAGLLKGIGRALLWTVVALLLIRGASDLLAVEEPVPGTEGSGRAATAWPDDEARAFALDFAHAYLSWSPEAPGSYSRGLEPFTTPDLRAVIVPEFGPRQPGQVVQTASVARVASVDERHALITVAATVASRGVTTRYLTVPIARDEHDGLVVSDLPSFSAPPARAQLPSPALEPLTGAERAKIERVLRRFFRAFLAGRTEALEYLVPAGVRMGALGERHELVGLESVALARPPSGRSREVLANVRARDPKTEAVYSLRYRLRLERRDRWYVAAVNNPTIEEG
jgi:hypothetical protein